MSRPKLTINHARSSHRLPVLLLGGQAYGPGDDIPAAGLRAIGRAAETVAAAAWVAQMPTAPAQTPRRAKSYRRPQTIDACFVDPREAEQQRVRDWIMAHRRSGR